MKKSNQKQKVDPDIIPIKSGGLGVDVEEWVRRHLFLVFIILLLIDIFIFLLLYPPALNLTYPVIPVSLLG